MRVLITGHRGYIGSVLARRCVEAGHQVTGVDIGFYDECTLGPPAAAVDEITADVRDLTAADLAGNDAIVHLAALSNDPVGNLNPAWTEEINLHASVLVAELARKAGVTRFLFSSSCIMYGSAQTGTAVDADVTEDSPLDPKTVYARSKVEAERAIARLASRHFSPVFLRNGTVYGFSPRMRFDTVINSLVGSALAKGIVQIHGDGTPWRPVVYIEDVASAFLAALEAPAERVHNQAFNTGASLVNLRVSEMADIVAATVNQAGIPCRIERLSRPDADQRTYRAKFDKIARLLPEFELRWSVPRGVRQLVHDLAGLGRSQFEDPRFTRLSWLRHLIDSTQVDGSLRRLGVAA
jgi:nucleoside-diphosphate-sugar epimerase